MAGQTRITVLEPAPSCAPEWEGSNYVAHISSFRSNYSDDHYVVSLSEQGTDESPMGYVDKRAAVDLACHFVAIANNLGANLALHNGDYVATVRAEAYGQGYKDGRDSEAVWRQNDVDNIAAKLRELADELS